MIHVVDEHGWKVAVKFTRTGHLLLLQDQSISGIPIRSFEGLAKGGFHAGSTSTCILVPLGRHNRIALGAESALYLHSWTHRHGTYQYPNGR
jgi:hypothetical protein